MRQIIKIILSVSVALVVAACGASDESPASANLTWFPLAEGYSWVYDVKEVTYDTLIQNKVLTYQEKYEIVDSYKNQLDETVYVMYRSTRDNEVAAWKYADTWSAKISRLNEVIVQEENIAYLKILLPISSGRSWKGNKYNDIESIRTNGRIDNFVIKDLEKPFGMFDKTFKVEESDDDNFSYQDVRYSIYADNVGLVYRINKYIEFCDENDCFGLGLRKHEVTKIQTLVAHDVE